MNGLDIAKIICPHAWDAETRSNERYREWALGLADEILILHQRATYKSFTDGMEAAAQICGSLAETTYDDSDSFEAATGCEASIMRVVKAQRKEQETPSPTLSRTTGDVL